MAWAVPEHSRGAVDRAGRTLIDTSVSYARMERAYDVINNWRSSHSFPLNTFQTTLRWNARAVDSRAIVAQRIKRLSSIEAKLTRFSWLTLSEMQDIGGCRAVVGSVRSVRRLVSRYKTSSIRHILDDHDDYIEKPKNSGYRGIHLIYRYVSDKKETYNHLKVEMQFRSPLQHAWATAVETVGTFTRQALKASRGEKEWLTFFKLMSSVLAAREKTPPVPGTPKGLRLITALKHYARELDVASRLRAYGAALNEAPTRKTRDAHYFLMELDPGAHRVIVTGYKMGELHQASEDYLSAERSIAGRPGAEAVLVSVESIAALRRAYPNYFLDTRVFLRALQDAL